MSGTGKQPTGTGQPLGIVKTKSYACGCVHRQALIVFLSLIYLTIVILSGVAVWGGIDDNQTHYSGQVKIDLEKYTVTKVNGTSLTLSTGWLKYNDGTNSKTLKDLSKLSTGSAVLGFLMAFMLLVSIIVAGWKFLGSCCIRKGHKSGGTCIYVLLCVLAVALQFAFLVVTSTDMDTYAHNKLGVSSANDIAMAPGYAWNCGTAAAFLWILAALFNACIPTQTVVEQYHKF